MSPIPFLSADLFIVSTNKLDCQYRAINHTQIKFPSFDPSPWFLLLTFVFLCCFYTHLRLMKSTQGRPLLHSSTQSITHVSAHIKTHLSLNYLSETFLHLIRKWLKNWITCIINFGFRGETEVNQNLIVKMIMQFSVRFFLIFKWTRWYFIEENQQYTVLGYTYRLIKTAMLPQTQWETDFAIPIYQY